MAFSLSELLSWENVPEKYWAGVLAKVDSRNYVAESSGGSFHCYNNVYKLNNYLYDITYEYSSRVSGPISITRKKVA